MIRAAQAGKLDTVMIYGVSRGSRDVGNWSNFRKAMMPPIDSVISATGQHLDDLTSSQDLLLELLTVGMGQIEVLGSRQKSLDGIEVPELKAELDRLRV